MTRAIPPSEAAMEAALEIGPALCLIGWGPPHGDAADISLPIALALDSFSAAAVQAERERCVKIAEAHSCLEQPDKDGNRYVNYDCDCVTKIATEIRRDAGKGEAGHDK